MKEQYYRLQLDDYAAPSFVDWTKDYFGTLDEVRAFIDALASNEKTRDNFAELIAAFRAYEAGNHNVMHHVGYQEVPLLEPVEVLGSVFWKQEHYAWTHVNTWGCSYCMRCETVETQHLWLSCASGFRRVVKARFKNLQYQGMSDSWYQLDDGYWGHPQIICSRDGWQYNRLAVQEQSWDDRSSALQDMRSFQDIQDVNLAQFCNDVFGNG